MLSSEQLRREAGPKLAAFCEGYEARVVLPEEWGQERTRRHAGATVDAEKARDLWEHQRGNECMRSTLIDCSSAASGQGPAVYSCTTGPGQLFVSLFLPAPAPVPPLPP